jgi:hypothetical protein
MSYQQLELPPGRNCRYGFISGIFPFTPAQPLAAILVQNAA